jgi:peptidoglycan/xylan/chitin deacetylase (PgdA/CDA1 family)
VLRRKPGDLLILLYHRVGAGDREIDLPIALFQRQVAALVERDRVLSLDEALRQGSSGGVVLTFDDGYRDFHRHVLPVLDRLRIPAVLYLASGFVGNGGAGVPPSEALSWSQVEEAIDSGLVTVASHTHTHANLSDASEHRAEEELRRSKELIEERLGRACRHFAYPWGVASAAADLVARRLFDTTARDWGINRRGEVDPYRLGRTPILRGDGPMFFRAKVGGWLEGEAFLYRAAGRGPWRKSEAGSAR